jgi:1-acyl-sn-glycerol-3-phosphate acyltransferase
VGVAAEPPPITPLYAAAIYAAWPVLHVLYRLRVSGRDHVPASGGFVLAANHESNFDPWPLGVPLYPQRKIRFMSKSELFNPIVGPPLRAVGGFPVERGTNSDEAIEAAVRLVRAGEVVAMFPEGTRARKGRHKKIEPRPRTGAARIALEAHVPLVPAAIAGTDRLSRLPRIGVVYGPPVALDGLDELAPREAAGVATKRLMEAIGTLRASL